MTTDKKNISKKINFITIKRIGLVNINKQMNLLNAKKFISSELLK